MKTLQLIKNAMLVFEYEFSFTLRWRRRSRGLVDSEIKQKGQD